MILQKHKSTLFGLAIFLVIFFSAWIAWKKEPGGTFSKTLFEKTPEVSYPKMVLFTPFSNFLEITETKIPDRVCNISDYGAVSDGQTDNTKAFAQAVGECAKYGGGHVTVPKGVYLTGPIKLQSNIDLHLEYGSRILFTTDLNAYLPVVFSRFEGIEYYNYSPPIYAADAENISITGSGILDGQGKKVWWDFSSHAIKNLYKMGNENVPVGERVFGTEKAGLRPTFVEFVNCKTILIDGVTLVNGPMWTIHPIYSQDIIVRNANIQTSAGPSTDGLAIDSSKNVLVENMIFNTGDDAVVLKSGRDADGRRVGKPTENIVIRDSHVVGAHGAVAIGSEMSGGIRNVLAQNIVTEDAQYGFRAKSNSDRGGSIENIWVKNFQIGGLSEAAVQFNMRYDVGGTKTTDYPPTFKNINVSDFICQNSSGSINFFGLPGGYLKDIHLNNISIGKSRNGLHFENAQDVTLDNINLNPKYKPVFEFIDAQSVLLSNSTCPLEVSDCLVLSGASSKNIRLQGNNFDQDKKKISFQEDANESELKIED